MNHSVSTYRTIASNSTAEFKDRGSKFLGFAFQLNELADVKKIINALKEEHPKAVHFCYAFRIGTQGDLFRAADDGEPAGSAGKPILGQIDSAELTNVLLVVVRYFGGTLLGVPGLINAYKTTAYDLIKASTIIEKKIEKKITIEFPYELMNEVMRILKLHHIRVITSEASLFCKYDIAISLDEWTISIEKLNALRIELHVH